MCEMSTPLNGRETALPPVVEDGVEAQWGPCDAAEEACRRRSITLQGNTKPIRGSKAPLNRSPSESLTSALCTYTGWIRDGNQVSCHYESSCSKSASLASASAPALQHYALTSFEVQLNQATEAQFRGAAEPRGHGSTLFPGQSEFTRASLQEKCVEIRRNSMGNTHKETRVRSHRDGKPFTAYRCTIIGSTVFVILKASTTQLSRSSIPIDMSKNQTCLNRARTTHDYRPVQSTRGRSKAVCVPSF
eukprot:1124100-Prorocentrum_minimum.AAC.2